MAGSETRDDKVNLELMHRVGFYSWDVQENKVYGDEVIAHIFGLPLADFAAGVPIDVAIRLIDDGDKQKAAKAIHDAILSGLPFVLEYGLTHPDGRKVQVAANGRCLRDPDGVPSIFSGTITIQPQPVANFSGDPLESHCRAALGIARTRRHALAARYLSSALSVLGAKPGA